MPHLVFFDNDPEIKWPSDLVSVWGTRPSLEVDFGVCTAQLETDRSLLGSILRQRKLPVDLLFVDLDWGYSSEDGIPLIAQARSLSPTLPIVVLTDAPFDSRLYNNCFQAGATAVWNKGDGKLKDLLELIEKELSKSAPMLRRANDLRKIKNRAEKALYTLQWLEGSVSSLPNELLSECLVWLQEGVMNWGSYKKHPCPSLLLFSSVLLVMQELSDRRLDIDVELRAATLFQMGRWDESETEYLRLVSLGSSIDAWERLACIASFQGNDEGAREYRTQQATACANSGDLDKAEELFSSLVTSHPGHWQSYFAWIDTVRKVGKTPKLIIKQLLLTIKQSEPDLPQWIYDLQKLETLGLSKQEIASALSSLAREAEWVDKLLIDWAYHLYNGGDTPGCKEICKEVSLEDLEDASTLLKAADLFELLDENNRYQLALRCTIINAPGISLGEETFQRYRDISEALGDIESTRDAFKRQMRFWAETNQPSKCQTASMAWLNGNSADVEIRELTADLLRRFPQFHVNSMNHYKALLEDPSVRSDEKNLPRILRKAFAIGDKSQKNEIEGIRLEISKEWAKTSRRLELPNPSLPLKNILIYYIGGDDTTRVQELQTLVVKNGGKFQSKTFSKALGKETDSVQKLTDKLNKDNLFGILDLRLSHSVSQKYWDALNEAGVRFVLIQKYEGFSTIVENLESEFGELNSD